MAVLQGQDADLPFGQLWRFVQEHTVRGACTCGQCVDAPANPQDLQPAGHTVDLTFFKIALQGDPDVDRFKELAAPLMPDRETSFIQLGGVLGDQGFAMQTMALGHLLGVWRLRSPDTEFKDLIDEDLKQAMAGRGMVTIEPLS